MHPIRTVAAVISNENGEVLLVRKRSSQTFIQPGGKTEPGEEPLVTLARELDEELGVRLDPSSAVRLGQFDAPAVNEPGQVVQAQAYWCSVHGSPVAQAEIEELAWINPAGPHPVRVAPLSAGHILPAYLALTAKVGAVPASSPREEDSMHPYRNFVLMILVASVLMFCLMYLNTYQASHVWFSQTRLFMTFIMAGSMGLVMLFFMRHMYKNRSANVAIVVGSISLMALGLWLVRSQSTVGDVAWMKAMIPHHSIAILTSERAGISDPRVRQLADEIIEAQRREIGEMESLIADLEGQETASSRE